MTVIQKAKRLINSEYSRIWQDWYDDRFMPAKLEIKESIFSSCYGINKNIIYLNYPESNLEDVVANEQNIDDYSISELGWDLWRREFVHEMLHEYQYKEICGKVTKTGKELYKKYKTKFSGEGHGPDFFTSIAEKSNYFSLTHEELIENL